MQLLSVLLLTSLSSMSAAAPAGILDKFCSETNNSPNCLDYNQNWGLVTEPEPEVEEAGDGSRPISFEPIKPIQAKPAKPATDPKEVCFDKSEAFYDNCLKVDKKPQNECIHAGDKLLDDCLAA